MPSAKSVVTAPGSAVRRGLVLALAGVVMFSFTLPVTKIALRGFDPLMIGMGRAALAGLVALVVLRLARVPWPGRAALVPLLLIGLGIVVGFPLLTTMALQSTTSAHAAVVIAGLPIATAVLAVIRAGERPSRAFWVAASSGTIALTAFAFSRGGAAGGDFVADLLLLGAVLAAAFGYVEGAMLARSMPGWQVISWVLVVMLPLTLSSSVFAGLAIGDRVAEPGFGPTLALLYLALVSMYLGFFAWYAGLHRAGVARASQVQLLQPVLTLIWSVLLLGEAVGMWTMLAAAAVLACVVWTQRARSAPSSLSVPPEAP
jgi:drug/metabolite transporter (DMT)-like permease